MKKMEESWMDWVVFIFLGVGLPSIGGAICGFMLFSKYSELKEESHDTEMDGSRSRPKFFGRYIIIQQMTFTPIVFGALILTLLWTSASEIDVSEEAFTNVALGSSIVIGITGFFRNITRGIIAKKGLEVITEGPENYGKVIVNIAIPDMCSIYGLLIAILALMGTGVLVGEFSISLAQSRELLTVAIIFSCFSAGILLSAVLFNKVEEPFLEHNYMKGILMNSTGTIIPLLGLIFAIFRFYEIGIL